MPSYAGPLGASGAAVGGGLSGALGRLLEPLDYPRQSLWNLPGKLLEGDWAGAAPGLAGLGLGAGLAATGVGIPLAILAGGVASGVGQGIGRGLDEERFAAPSASHLVEALGGDPESGPGMVGAMALNALGDPLTYAGGVGLGGLGARGGRHLENVALTRGPRYAGGAEKLLFGAESASPEALAAALKGQAPVGMEKVIGDRLAAMHRDPNLARLLAEVPPGSVPLGLGAEATVFRTPQGGALRIAGGPGALDMRTHSLNTPTAPSAAINIPEMLKPARDVPIGPYRVQHSPLVDVAPGTHNDLHPMWQELEAAQRPLENALVEKRGLNPLDLHSGNIGRTPSGRYVVTDPGAILLPGHAAAPEPFTHAPGGRVSNLLLDLLGADRSVQGEIASTLAKGGAGQGLHLPEARQIGDMARGRLPGILADARANRDAAWQELLRVEPGHRLTIINDAANNLALMQSEVNDARMALGQPMQLRGTPLRPFLEPGRLSRLQHPLDLAELANKLRG